MATTSPSIPGLTRIDPTTPRHLLEHRITVIDKRRAEIEATLDGNKLDHSSYKAQELATELRALLNMRLEAESILHPQASPARHPALQRCFDRQREHDRRLLLDTIRIQSQQIEWNAEREERAGNHRQARLLRGQILELPETVCREFGLDPSLLAEPEAPNDETPNSPQVQVKRNLWRGPPRRRARPRGAAEKA